VHIRPVRPDDAVAIQAIYAHHVLHGLGTFEEEPPPLAEMQARLAKVADQGLPWLVAEQDGAVAGYGYAGLFHVRSAYRFTVEDSLYIHPNHLGCGVGSALLGELIARCTALGLRQMVALIGDSGNAGSLAVHRKHDFSDAGLLKSVGWKHGRWVDVVFMQRPLGVGDASVGG
jgi:L-amino acid N-acyltransferase YncA